MIKPKRKSACERESVSVYVIVECAQLELRCAEKIKFLEHLSGVVPLSLSLSPSLSLSLYLYLYLYLYLSR